MTPPGGSALSDEPEIEIANQQTTCPVDEARIRQVVAAILHDAGICAGAISIAVVDDPTIHELNRRHLQHDYPTDVISFVLDREGSLLEGEVVVSADTAQSVAADLAWPTEDELLLYVVHGTLHLVGYDDVSDTLRAEMREKERHYLAQFGLTPPWQPE